MKTQATNSHRVYVIRCWQIQSEIKEWRFAVERVRSGKVSKRQGLTSFAELLQFLSTELDPDHSDS